MTLESLELNKKLDALTFLRDRLDIQLPYWTFGWRNIDFDKPIPLGLEPFQFDDEKPHTKVVGFLGKPKHGYQRWKATEEQSKEIKRLCEELVKDSTSANSEALFNYLQTCKPTEIKSDQDQNTLG